MPKASPKTSPRPGLTTSPDPRQIDFTADAPGALASASSDLLKRITNLAESRASTVSLIETLEERLKAAKERLRHVEEVELVEALDLAGMEEFKTKDGVKIGVKRIVAGSIPSKTADEAFKWLRENGHGGLIKREVSVSFGKGEDQTADETLELLRRYRLEPKDKTTVHAQTLGAWAREMIDEGETIPLDILGIYVGRRATVLK